MPYKLLKVTTDYRNYLTAKELKELIALEKQATMLDEKRKLITQQMSFIKNRGASRRLAAIRREAMKKNG